MLHVCFFLQIIHSVECAPWPQCCIWHYWSWNLTKILDAYCGTKGDPLKCFFLSYLKGHFNLHKYDLPSFAIKICCLVFPKAQSWGQYKIYTTPLCWIIQRHGLTYADDTQLFMTFKHYDVTSKYDAISRIEACMTDIRIWMNYNFLKSWQKLNFDHTAREELSKMSELSTKAGNQSISPSDDPPKM